MPEPVRALDDCLEALREGRNLQDVLRRYPNQRDELIQLLQVSVDLGQLQPPPPDPAFKLRTRNRMLALAAERRAAWRWSPARFATRLLPRAAFRLAVVGAVAAAFLLGALTAAASGSLPGDPLYSVKTGFEQVQLAVTLDPAANARLRVQLAERRLDEAQRLIALGQLPLAIAVIDEYGATLSGVNQVLAAAPIRGEAADALSRYLDDRQHGEDARLDRLASSLTASGHPQAAAAVAHAESHADQEMKGSQRSLHSHDSQRSEARPTPSDHEGR